MLLSLRDLKGYAVMAEDGEAGTVVDVFFEDDSWMISDLIVDTGRVFHGRKVLIPIEKCTKPDGKSKQIPVTITKAIVKDSAGISTKIPISKQKELEEIEASPAPSNPAHLRSIQEVLDYTIQATDGTIGHVEDFIFEDDTWKLRYLVVDTRKWLMGKKVLIGIDWFDHIDWNESKFYLNHTKENIKNSPEFDPATPINRKVEEILYDYHGRPHYWN